MDTRELLDPSTTWYEKLASYLLMQGPTTVLLFLIVLGVWKEMPTVVSSVQGGYSKNAEELYKTAVMYQSTTERLLNQMLKDRELMLELARENRARINQLVGRLKIEHEETIKPLEDSK